MIDPASSPIARFSDPDQIHHDGHALLRAAIPAAWLDSLRAEFDAGVRANDQWPVPRDPQWRHSLLDLSPTVQAVCRLPRLLEAAGELVGEKFFLAQVEGREPLPGCGHQGLHRDLSSQRPGDTALSIAFLDDYGPANGATRIVPASHRPAPGHAPFDLDDVARALQLSGGAGDILVFDADLLHAGSLNLTGARRRSLLISYFAQPLYESNLATAPLRGIRMAPAWFEPANPRDTPTGSGAFY